MYQVVGKDMIVISRGDYALVPIKFTGAEDGENVIFSIAKQIDPEDVVFERTLTIEDGLIYVPFTQQDTIALGTGRFYWDVNLPDFWEQGQRHTPVLPRTLEIVGVSHVV